MGNESTMDAMSPNTMKNTMQRYGFFGNLQDILFIL